MLSTFETINVVVENHLATVTITREAALNALSSKVINELTVDPLDENIVYVGGQSGLDSLLKSENGGTSWNRITVGVGVNAAGPHVSAWFAELEHCFHWLRRLLRLEQRR